MTGMIWEWFIVTMQSLSGIKFQDETYKSFTLPEWSLTYSRGQHGYGHQGQMSQSNLMKKALKQEPHIFHLLHEQIC